MPQKRNPSSSCYIHAAVSVVRQHAAALMDAMIADHERSTGPWEIEWIVLPDGGRTEADPVRARGPGGRHGTHARQYRFDEWPRDVRGGDDGARSVHRARIRARPRVRHLPRGGPSEPPPARPTRRAP